MASVILWGWDSVNSTFAKVLVDASGHLQVDTLSSALPTGAATLAKQTDQLTKLNSIITLLAGGLPAALDTLALKVREQGTPQVICTGYDGAAQQKLLVESAANPNLRAKLYDGASGIDSGDMWTEPSKTARGLDVISLLFGHDVPTNAPYRLLTDYHTDNLYPYKALIVNSKLFAWDGSGSDRLRCYTGGILKVARAEAGLSSSGILTGDTAVKSSAGKVYWITIAGLVAVNIELNDSVDDSGTDLWGVFLAANSYFHINFDPPLEFTNGIWVDISAGVRVTVGYI